MFYFNDNGFDPNIDETKFSIRSMGYIAYLKNNVELAKKTNFTIWNTKEKRFIASNVFTN